MYPDNNILSVSFPYSIDGKTTNVNKARTSLQLPVASPSFMQETATMARISVVDVYIRRIASVSSAFDGTESAAVNAATAVGVAALCHQGDYIAVRWETPSHTWARKRDGDDDRYTRQRYIIVVVVVVSQPVVVLSREREYRGFC